MYNSDLEVMARLGYEKTAQRITDEIESLRQQLADRESDLKYEYEERIKAESDLAKAQMQNGDHEMAIAALTEENENLRRTNLDNGDWFDQLKDDYDKAIEQLASAQAREVKMREKITQITNYYLYLATDGAAGSEPPDNYLAVVAEAMLPLDPSALDAIRADAARYQYLLHHMGLVEEHVFLWNPAEHKPLLEYIQDFIDINLTKGETP